MNESSELFRLATKRTYPGPLTDLPFECRLDFGHIDPSGIRSLVHFVEEEDSILADVNRHLLGRGRMETSRRLVGEGDVVGI